MKSFENWFADQVNNGLVDIRLSVIPGKGMTSEAIKNELLACEAAIDAGRVREFPLYATVIPDDVMAVILDSRI